jgi:hypothetical protein
VFRAFGAQPLATPWDAGGRARTRWSGCFVGQAIFVCVILPLASQATEEDANRLLAALASGNCESRALAISSYSRSDDNERDHNAALKRLVTAVDRSLQDRVGMWWDANKEQLGRERLIQQFW